MTERSATFVRTATASALGDKVALALSAVFLTHTIPVTEFTPLPEVYNFCKGAASGDNSMGKAVAQSICNLMQG